MAISRIGRKLLEIAAVALLPRNDRKREGHFIIEIADAIIHLYSLRYPPLRNGVLIADQFGEDGEALLDHFVADAVADPEVAGAAEAVTGD